MSGGMLSGREILAAAARNDRYNRAVRNSRKATLLRPWYRLQARRLEKQPRLFITGLHPSAPAISNERGGFLNPNSYNLTLHDELLVYDIPITDTPGVKAPANHWDDYALDVARDNPTKKLLIPSRGLVLMPGRLYLGRTVEYTETYNLVPMIDGRSSTGRLGMFIHITAGFGDRGWKGHWTLEIGVIHPLRIYPGLRLAQVSYHRVGPGWDYRGKYNNRFGSEAGASQLWKEFKR